MPRVTRRGARQCRVPGKRSHPDGCAFAVVRLQQNCGGIGMGMLKSLGRTAGRRRRTGANRDKEEDRCKKMAAEAATFI